MHLYRLYFVAKQWMIKIFAPAKNKILFPLLNKSTIHVVIALIAITVVVNNLYIQETRAEEFGQRTILGTMVTGIQDIDIIETAIAQTNQVTTYYQSNGILSQSDYEQSGRNSGADYPTSNIVTSSSSAALLKPSLASTSIGDRPRDAVIFYTVEGGDTVSLIAEKFNVSTNTILWENKLGVRDYIKPGDQLTILPQSGTSHQVKSGETLAKIASKYKVESDDILEYNKLAAAEAIEVDQILIIPGGTIDPPKPRTTSTSGLASFSVPPSAANTSGTNLLWPTTGRRISQYYKWRHAGIDIGGSYSSPVYASDDGRIELADSSQRGYGLQIIINHGNGIKTRYAHESKIFVRVGDFVQRGQTIGMIGCTGWCTGPHVHFEVIVGGRTVNPLSYL